MSKLPNQNLVKIGEAARRLGVSIDTLRRWEKVGKISSTRTPGGTRLYSLQELELIVPASATQISTPVISDSKVEVSRTDKDGGFKAPEWMEMPSEDGSLKDDIKHPNISQSISTEPKVVKSPGRVGKIIGTTILASSLPVILTLVMFAFNLVLPAKAQDFFASANVLPKLLSPFNSVATVFLGQSSGGAPPGESPADFSAIKLINPNNPRSSGDQAFLKGVKNVLAESTEGYFLEINSDTTIKGNLTAQNIIYSIKAGTNISITGEQDLTITADIPETLLRSDPDTTQTITATSASATGLSVAAPTSASVDIFNVTNNAGTTKYLTVSSGGNVGIGGSTTSTTLYVTGSFQATGASTLGSTLAVTGASTLSGAVTASSTLKVSGSSTLSGAVTAGGSLEVSGASTLSGAVAASSSLVVTGATTLSSTLALTGAATLSSYIQLAQISAPSTTTNRLYNVSGDLVWNSINMTAGGALPVGTNTQTLYNASGTWTATSNFVNDGTDITTTGDLAVNGGDLTTTNTTATLFNSTATTLSLGGAATTALNLGNGSGNYTAINLGSGAGTHTINIAGTGATAADIINIGTGGTAADTISIGTGAVANTITIGSSASTTVSITDDHWSVTAAGAASFGSTLNADGATTLAALTLDANSNFAMSSGTGTFTQTFTGTTTDAATITASSLTTGTALTLTGPTSTGVTDHFIKATSDIGSAASLLNLNPDFSGSAVTGYGIYNVATDSTANGNTDYGYYGSLALTGNAAKTGYGIYQTITSTSTTADTLYSADLLTDHNAASASGNKTLYGLRSQVTNDGITDAAGTHATYGGYFSSVGNTGGTSTGYGIYATATGADTNWAGYFAGDIGLSAGSDILATGSNSDIGSSTTRFANGYFDNLDATNISGTIVTGSTSSSTWTINSDNATNDSEAMSLVFERGSATPNAALAWDITAKEFDFNAGINLTGTIASTTGLTLTTFTTDITAGSGEALSFILQDNITDSLDVEETVGGRNYINVNTTNSSENVAFGNATTNPSFSFLGTGAVTIAGSADGTDALVLTAGDLLISNGDFDLSGGDFNVTLDDQDVINLSGTAASSTAGNGAAAANLITATGPAGQATSGTTGQTGGAGSAFSFTGGVGGAATGASGTQTGGAGGALTLVGGAGGAATSGNGGAGGAFSITAGAAGSGGNASGGTLTLNSGALTGSGTSTINLGTSNSTVINIGDSTVTKTIDIGGVDSSAADTINLATNSTAADTIAIGNTHASTTLALTGGDDWSMAATGILTMSASASQTTAIVITDTDYTNSLSIGDNTITGTTANIDLTYFDVAGSTGAVTIDPQTTGTYLDFTLDTAWTSGTLINADFGDGTTQGAAAIAGMLLDLNTNLTAPAAGQNVTGYDIKLPVASTTSNTTVYTGFNLSTAGAITNGTAGSFAWRGANIAMPNITQNASGSVTSSGLLITTGTITTAGTQHGINLSAAGVGAGTLNGINIGGITASGGTETAINIGSGWDSDINATTSLEIAVGGTNELKLDSSVFSPATTDSSALGSTSLYWSDLFLASAGVVNFNNDITITHATDILAIEGGSVGIGETTPGDTLHVLGELTLGAGTTSVSNSISVLRLGAASTAASGQDISVNSSADRYGAEVRPTFETSGASDITTGTFGMYINNYTNLNFSQAASITNAFGLYIDTGTYTDVGSYCPGGTCNITNTYGLYVKAPETEGGNAAVTAYFEGNVGIGDTTPASLFVVGDGEDFQVGSTGIVTAAANINANGGLDVDDAFVVADGGGTLTIADNFWVGLGSSSGRVEFDDQTTDEINFFGANVSVSNFTTITPSGLFQVGSAEHASSSVFDQSFTATGINSGLYVSPSTKISGGGTVAAYSAAKLSPSIFVADDGTTLTGYYGLNIDFMGGATINQGTITNAYGLNIAPIDLEASTSLTNSWSLYVSEPDEGTNKYTAYFEGNVGIGDTSPSSLLEVGNGTDSLQVSSVGDMTFVDADGAASITGPAGGALTVAAGAARALTLTANLGSTWSTSDGLLTITGDDGLTLNATSTAGITGNVPDNLADAIDIQQGTNNYINVNTTNSSEALQFGNATTNPTFSFLGTGAVAIGTTPVPQIGLRLVNSLSGSTSEAGMTISSTFNSSATTDAIAIDIGALTFSNASYTITDAVGLNIRPTWSKGASVTVTNAFGIRISNPNFTSTNQYGIYVDAPTGGSTINAAAYFGSNVGIADTSPDYTLELSGSTMPEFALSESGVAHGITDVSQTDVFFNIDEVTEDSGGARVMAFSDAVGTIPMRLAGLFGANPTDTVAAITLEGMKKGAGAGTADLDDAETVLQIINHDNAAAVTVLGSGNIGIGTAAPSLVSSAAYGRTISILTTDGSTRSLLELGNSSTSIADEVGFGQLSFVMSGGSTSAPSAAIVGISEGTAETSAHLALFTMNAGTTTENMRIQHDGNVGIGITGPSALLHVDGNSIFGEEAITTNTAIMSIGKFGGASGDASDLTFGNVTAYGVGNGPLVTASATGGTFITNYVWSRVDTTASNYVVANQYGIYVDVLGEVGGGSVTNAYGIYVGKPASAGTNTTAYFSCNGSTLTNNPSTCADYAEAYSSDGTAEVADIVASSNVVDNETTRSTQSYQNNIMGVYSTDPGLLIGGGISVGGRGHLADNQIPVALVGRVPVKISNGSQPINKGDYITSSSEAGKGMKATRPGQVVGKALESWTPGSGKDKILIFVNVGFADPNDVLANLMLDSDGSLIIPEIKAEKIVVSGDVNVGGALKVSRDGIDQSTLVDVGQAITDLEDKSTDFASNLNSLQSSVISLQMSTALFQMKESTNSAQLAVLGESVASASAEIAEQDSAIATLANDLSDIKLKLMSPESLLATGSATLANINISEKASIINLEALDATISATFKSLGDTFLGRTTIAGDLYQDGTFSITNGSTINAFPILKLQDSPLAELIDIFDGLVTIDNTGKLAVESLAVGSKTLDTVTIPAGSTKVTITTDQLTVKSKVFTSASKAVSVAVTRKDTVLGEFDIEISQPQLTELTVDWWIVEQK